MRPKGTTRPPRKVRRPPPVRPALVSRPLPLTRTRPAVRSEPSDENTSGRPASSSGATNSCRPAFSLLLLSDHLVRTVCSSGGTDSAADVESDFCCFIVFCHNDTLHAHENKNKDQVSPFQNQFYASSCTSHLSLAFPSIFHFFFQCQFSSSRRGKP